MIKIDDPALYETALAVLKDVVGDGYLGRLVQMVLACKHYGKQVPHIGDATGISSREFERLLDDLYRKPNRPDAAKILILFAAEHKVPTGVIAGDLTSAANIWRNNLNFQKGYMCYGAPAELQDAAFRNPSRTLCPHLLPAVPGQLKGATCAISGGASYRNEDHPKAFRKDPESGRYFVYDPGDTDFYRNIILPANGEKLPIVALVIALYHDSRLAAGRSQVGIDDFAIDFDMSPAELAQYFEDDPNSEAHARLRAVNQMLAWGPLIAAPPAQAPQPLPGEGDAEADGLEPVPDPLVPKSKAKVPLVNPPSTQTSAPPAGSHWWSAEQAVRSLLESDGWVVMDVSRLGIGCDMKATKGQTLRLVEVKSALGPCSPMLTEREYAQAKESRKQFVLAIVENFDPLKPAAVQWIHDPARLQVSKRQVTQYFLPRSVWKHPATGVFPADKSS